MTTTLRERSRTLAAALVALVLLLGAAACEGTEPAKVPAAPVPVPVVAPVGLKAGKVPWDRPLTLSVANGTIKDVDAVDDEGLLVPGEVTDSGWQSIALKLVPDTTYRATARAVDSAGRVRSLPLTLRTAPPARTLRAVLSPGDGKVVGVGMPVIATLNHAITDPMDRRLIEGRLSVTTQPAVSGAWRWMSPTELHYRGPDFWAAGTKISAGAHLDRLELSGGTWGAGDRDTSYTIGRRIIATVDVAKHVMNVVRDGVLLRTVKVSTGRDKYPTKGGVHLVLEKTKLKIMDSATVGIPREAPDGYYEKVPNSVRISYSGEFVHSAGWSVDDQGVRNVSHGCVNVSPSDSAWFFDLVRRGDVVDVINSKAPPKLSDPGTSDWNIPFAQWGN